MKESNLVKSLIFALNFYGFFWRNNTGAHRVSSKSGERFVRFGLTGSADIIGLVDGKFIAIEAKSDKGVQSDEQKKFQEKVESNGGIYILSREIEQTINIIKDIKSTGKNK